MDSDLRMNQRLLCWRHLSRDGVAGGGIVPTGPVTKEEDHSTGVGSCGVRGKRHRYVVQSNSCQTRRAEIDHDRQVGGTTGSWPETPCQTVYVGES